MKDIWLGQWVYPYNSARTHQPLWKRSDNSTYVLQAAFMQKKNVSDSSYQNRGIMKEISSFSRINAKRLLLKSICSPNPIHKCLPFWPFFNVQLTSFPSLLLAAGWDSTCCCCFECWSDSTCSPTHLCPEQNELMDRLMDKWMDEWMNEWMLLFCMLVWLIMYGSLTPFSALNRMNELMDGWMNE